MYILKFTNGCPLDLSVTVLSHGIPAIQSHLGQIEFLCAGGSSAASSSDGVVAMRFLLNCKPLAPPPYTTMPPSIT